LSVVEILAFFAKAVLANVGMLVRETRCLEMARRLLRLFAEGTVDKIAEARALTQKHHVLFKEVYGVTNMTIKIHLAPHVIDSWEYWKRLFSCFQCERHHKLACSAYKFAYNKCTKTATAHVFRSYIEHLKNPAVFEPVKLAGRRQSHFVEAAFGRILTSAPELILKHAHLYEGDVVSYGVDSFGKCENFICVELHDGRREVVAAIAKYSKISPSAWCTSNAVLELVPHVSLLKSLVYASDGDTIVPMIRAEAMTD
jgi:hypothetical protein